MRVTRRLVTCGMVALLTTGLLSLADARPAAATLDTSAVQAAFKACEAKFRAAGLGKVIDQLNNSKRKFKVVPAGTKGTGSEPTDKDAARDSTGTGGETRWDPNDRSPFGAEPEIAHDPCATLYHEMKHLMDYDDGRNFNRAEDLCTVNVDGQKIQYHDTIAEVHATHAENEYRASQPDLKDKQRKKYNDFIPPPKLKCKEPIVVPKRGCLSTLSGGGGRSVWARVADGASCAISNGDPHLTTFDGERYDLQAVGEFVLVESATGDLVIQARQAAFPGSDVVAVNTAIAIDVAGDRVGLYLTDQGMVLRIGGAVTPLSGSRKLDKGGTVELLDDGTAEVAWPDGSSAVVHPIGVWGLTVEIGLADARQGQISGVLGNFDGEPANDLVVRGGAAVATPPAFEALYPGFADSWRVQRSLFDYGPGQDTSSFTDRAFPARPVRADDLPNRQAAEAICRQAGVRDPVSMQNCVLDVGLTGQASFAIDAAQTQPVPLDADGTVLTVTRPGDTAMTTFTASAGQKVFIDVVSSTLPDNCNTLSLLDPAGQPLRSGCIINGTGHLDGTELPTSGLYTILIDPAEETVGEARVRVVIGEDQRIPIAADGPEVTAQIAQPGVVSQMTFDAAAGQKVYLDVTSSTLPDDCGVLSLLDPGGTPLNSGCIINGTGYIDGTDLPTAGRYTIVIDPDDRRTGQAVLRLTSAVDERTTIAVDGPEVATAIAQPGAVSRLTFDGIAGQQVRVEVVRSTLPDDCGALALFDAAGVPLAGGCIIAGAGSIATTTLPANGSYTVVVDPDDRRTGQTVLRLRT